MKAARIPSSCLQQTGNETRHTHPYRYDTPLRGEGEPVYVVLPCPVPDGARRIVMQARVSFKDHASVETRRLEFAAFLDIQRDDTVRLEPYKVGADEGHYPGEGRRLPEEELGMWVSDEWLGGCAVVGPTWVRGQRD